eukprot:COSAG05_NODE_2147_length_3478_cov_3.426458_5_plen_51_part_01
MSLPRLHQPILMGAIIIALLPRSGGTLAIYHPEHRAAHSKENDPPGARPSD